MTSRAINRAIKHTDLTLVYTRGDGYFYFIDPEGNQCGESVLVCYLNHLSLDRWVEEAEGAAIEGPQ